LQDSRKLASHKLLSTPAKSGAPHLPYQMPKLCRSPLAPAASAQPIAVRRSKEYAGSVFGLRHGSHTSLWSNYRNSAKYCLFLGRRQAGGEEIVRCGDAI
jgi:hypothetical protein